MFKFKSKKSIITGFFISIFIIVFTFFTFFTGTSNFLQIIGSYIDDNLLYKNFYSDWIHNDNIIIIKIDDKTLNALQKGDLGMLAFSKKTYADFLDNVFEKYNARVVGIDVVFSNKSTFGEEDENILRDTFLKYKDRVVISTRGDNKDTPLCKYYNVQHGASEWFIENRVRKFQIFYEKYNTEGKCDNVDIYEGNIGGIFGFPIEVYKKNLSYLNEIVKTKHDKIILDDSLKIIKNGLDKQLEKNNGMMFTKFFKNDDSNVLNIGTKGFKSYSLIDILQGNTVDSNGIEINLDGKIVLLGEVGTLLHDRHFSPVAFDEKISGVEFHANAIETMISGLYLYNIKNIYIFLALVLTIIIFYIIIINTRTIIGFSSLFILFLIHLLIGLKLFEIGFIYPIFFFAYSLLFGFIIIYLYKYVTIDKQKIYIKKAFSMFLSPEMVNLISEDPSKLNLKGEKGYLTIFFSDIENFTGISEKISPNDLFNFLNEYLSIMTKILTDNKGTLDKYIGDSIMGFFNAPVKTNKHEYLACKTAIEQQRELDKLNKKWSKKGSHNFKVRIGINSGDVIHGNLGSLDNRINYTVIGDNVNLASRLEGVNKIYGTNIIISENTYNQVKDEFITRELDTINVKGKSKKTKIFELICFKGEKYDEIIIKNYEAGLGFYYLGEYNKAINSFKKNIKDTPSIIMILRCKNIINGNIKLIDGAHIITKK